MYLTNVCRLVSARIDVVKYANKLICQGTDGSGWPCTYLPHWVVAWAVNPSGLPGLAEEFTDYVCDTHLPERLHWISFEHTTAATVIPFEQKPQTPA